jgi:hypothetical protein
MVHIALAGIKDKLFTFLLKNQQDNPVLHFKLMFG